MVLLLEVAMDRSADQPQIGSGKKKKIEKKFALLDSAKMVDRVHPHDSVPKSPNQSPSTPLVPKPQPSSPPVEPPQSPPSTTKPAVPPPPPQTYVIKIPKDQVFRVPPPQNAKLFERYSRRSSRRRSKSCCCIAFLVLAAFIFITAAAAGTFYLVVKPESPSYSVTGISISGFNLTSASAAAGVSPEFKIAVRAVNPNDKMGIYHVNGGSVAVLYRDVKLGDGVLAAFRMPSNSETAFNVTVAGKGVVVGSEAETALVNGEKEGRVALRVRVRAPVKFKVGAVKTWKITVKLSCDVTVDKLTAAAKIVSQDCNYGVDIF